MLLSPYMMSAYEFDFDYDKQVEPSGRWRCLQEQVAPESIERGITLDGCISLHFDGIVDEDAAAVVSAALEEYSNRGNASTAITVLDIEGSALRDVGLVKLAPALAACRSLEAFHAYNNRIGAHGARALREHVTGHPTLRLLDLNGNALDDTAAIELAELLRPPHYLLMQVRLDDNHISAAGAAAIADALRTNIGLRALHLSGNPIGDDGCRALASAFYTNRALEALYIYNTGITDEGVKALLLTLPLSRVTTLELVRIDPT